MTSTFGGSSSSTSSSSISHGITIRLCRWMIFGASVLQVWGGDVSQIHLSVTGPKSQDMRIAWRIDNGDASVSISHDNGASWQNVTTDKQCSYYVEGVYQSAVFDNLLPKQQYLYHFVDENHHIVREGKFISPPNQNSTVTLSVLADFGYGQAGQATDTYNTLMSLYKGVDAFIHAGDIAYQDDAFWRHWISPVQFAYEHVYNKWMDWMEPMMKEKAYMVCPGNHECECHSPRCIVSSEKRNLLANFSSYNCRWPMPYEDSGATSSMWYSWDYGPIHFVSVNTETDWDGASEQSRIGMHLFPAGHFGRDGEYLEWLENNLKKADKNREERPWVVAYGHRPFYRDGSPECYEPALCASHEKLFQQYHVDAFINGHVHMYNRNVPRDKSRPYHLGVGGAGCDEWPSRSSAGKFEGQNSKFDYMWDATTYQTAILKVSRTSFDWLVIDSKTNETVDHVTMEARPYGWEEPSIFGSVFGLSNETDDTLSIIVIAAIGVMFLFLMLRQNKQTCLLYRVTSFHQRILLSLLSAIFLLLFVINRIWRKWD